MRVADCRETGMIAPLNYSPYYTRHKCVLLYNEVPLNGCK